MLHCKYRHHQRQTDYEIGRKQRCLRTIRKKWFFEEVVKNSAYKSFEPDWVFKCGESLAINYEESLRLLTS